MKLYGVFIGINQYRDPRISSLQYAVADAKHLYAGVAGSLPADEIHLRVMVDQQATKTEILKVLGEKLPRMVTSDDSVLLYFAGHGSPETTGSVDQTSRYLITYDTEYESIFATALDVEHELTRLIQRLRAKLIIVVLDACFSGRAGGRTFEGPALAQARAGWRGGVKLAHLQLGEGRVMLSACDDDEVASEASSLKHGIFTYYLIQALAESATGESWISINSLYDRVAQEVRTYTMGRQTPILNGRVSMARLPRLKIDGTREEEEG